MNLARGAGLRGLCGIPPVNGNIIRPLINVSRRQIEEYLTQHNLKYVDDASNSSHEYTRNRVRHTIIPAIESAINPNAVQTIANNTYLLQEDSHFLETMAGQAFADCAKLESQRILLDIEVLTTLPPPIARRVVLRGITQMQNLVDCFAPHGMTGATISQAHINSVLNLIHKKAGSEAHIPGLIAYHQYTHIIITKPITTKLNTYPLPLDTPTHIPELHLTITISTAPPDILPENANIVCTKCFNYDNVIEMLFLRPRRPGDKISAGSVNKPITKKLQNYFTDTKTPRHIRDTIPLLACGNDIIWIIDHNNKTSTKYHPSSNNMWVTLRRDMDARNA